MSQAYDAKVLRSNETSLTLEELRLLYSNLEVGDNTVQDLRKLTNIGDKLEAALGDYYQRVDAAILESRRFARGPNANLETINNALNLIISQLDESLGQEFAPDVILTLPEWQWIMDRWKANSKFVGRKDIRVKLLRIDDAVTQAKGVRFTGHSMLIEDEPERLASGG